MKHRLVLLLLVLGLLFSPAALSARDAFAGGWAVVTLDALPDAAVSGEPLVVGFTVLQHGTHPMEGLSPTVNASHATTGEKIGVAAEAEGKPGHYVAQLTLPSAGTWNWSIEAFTGTHAMPPITVAPTAAASARTADALDSVTAAPLASAGDGAERPLAMGLGAAGASLLAAAIAMRIRSLRLRQPAGRR